MMISTRAPTAATGSFLIIATLGVAFVTTGDTTGGIFTHNPEERSVSVVEKALQHRTESAVAAPEDVRTPAENLTYVRDWLGISATDLAKVCGVSRQAVHKWLRQKAEPTRENAQTLRDLSHIADSFQNSGLRNGRHLLTVGVKGETLLDAVREGRDYAALLATIIQSAKASQDRYDQSGLAERPQRNQEAWNPYFYPALSPLQRDA